jgi:hypothetical protein
MDLNLRWILIKSGSVLEVGERKASGFVWRPEFEADSVN